METSLTILLEINLLNAKSAIDKIVDMEGRDRDRVGVGGHSYGAFMATNLLAHSDLLPLEWPEVVLTNITPFGSRERRGLTGKIQIYTIICHLLCTNKVNDLFF